MKEFLKAQEREILLILLTMLGVARWWMPRWTEMQNMYSASHWALSYDNGLVRRGLVGTLVKPWMPVVTLSGINLVAAVAYGGFVLLLAAVFYLLLRSKEREGRVTRLLLLFAACPATLSLLAHNIGRFDLFLAALTLVGVILIGDRRFVWLLAPLAVLAMFLHEGFLLLWAPTLLGMMLFLFARDRGDRRMLGALAVSACGVGGAFLALYRYGTPAVAYEEFVRLVQSRADFRVTELSLRECYFSTTDHIGLTLPYFTDPGAMINLAMALLVLSPVALVLGNVWRHALRSGAAPRWATIVLLLATLSGVALFPIATDFGRWLSAMTLCNFYAIFFLFRTGVVSADDLKELSHGSFPYLFMLLFLTYLLFGPLHDWMPYPYQDQPVVSALVTIAILLFDVGYVLHARSVRRGDPA
jgi:hypothetical protein